MKKEIDFISFINSSDEYIINNVTVTNTNTHIEDSYRIPESLIELAIIFIKIRFPKEDLAINKLSTKNMIEEWKAHNLLYKLHIARNRTRSVDLDIYESKFRRFCYKILAWI